MTFTLQLAAFAVGFTFIIRALAPTQWRLFKPIGCSLCMAWWPSFVLGASHELATCASFTEFLMRAPDTALVVGGATGIAYLVNKICDLVAFNID